MRQIELPRGMRDTLPEVCRKKRELQRKTESVYESYGYQPVETPLIEFWSTYANAFGSIREEEMYKFVDESGQILALRTDMTLPIARICAAKYQNVQPPFRFYYSSNVYKVRQAFAGKRNEVTDCGIELIGLDEESDAEILCCAMDVMKELFTESFTLEVTDSRFFRKAASGAGLSDGDMKKLADLIDRKSLPDLHMFLSGLCLDEAVREFFERMPLLNGKDALLEAEEVCFDDELRDVIRGLRDLHEVMDKAGCGDRMTFDLGKLPHLDYYTGIIFEGFAKGFPAGVLSGGRYDALLKKLGRDLPACGFGVKLDNIAEAAVIPETKIRRLYYPKTKKAEALLKARELRKEGPVEMIPADIKEAEVR